MKVRSFTFNRLGRQAAVLLLCLVVGALAHASEILTQTFASQLLQRDYRYTVYLPDGYAQATRPYPVLYLLHGAGGDEREWLDFIGARDTLDQMMAAGQIRPMVVVMPGHPQAWWVDGAREPGESVLLQELLPQVQARFKVSGAREQRLVAGLSAGGYGALNLVLKHPQLFAAAALFSPAIYETLPPAHSSAMTQPPFQSAGRFDPQRWQDLNYPRHLEGYQRSGFTVPMYIVSGDRDNLGIALQSAQLYEKLRLHQSGAIALRIVEGDHDGVLWRAQLPQALLFLNARLGKE